MRTFEREIARAKRISGMASAEVHLGTPGRFALENGIEIALARGGELLGTLRISDEDDVPLSSAQIDQLQSLAATIASQLAPQRASSQLTPI